MEQRIDTLKDFFQYLSSEDVLYLLERYPWLADCLDITQSLTNEDASCLLRSQPQLFDFFKERNFSSEDICLILSHRPLMHHHFDLSMVPDDQLNRLINKQPCLGKVEIKAPF